MQSVNGAVVIVPRNSFTEEVRQIKGQTIGFHPQTQNLEEQLTKKYHDVKVLLPREAKVTEPLYTARALTSTRRGGSTTKEV